MEKTTELKKTKMPKKLFRIGFLFYKNGNLADGKRETSLHHLNGCSCTIKDFFASVEENDVKIFNTLPAFCSRAKSSIMLANLPIPVSVASTRFDRVKIWNISRTGVESEEGFLIFKKGSIL